MKRNYAAFCMSWGMWYGKGSTRLTGFHGNSLVGARTCAHTHTCTHTHMHTHTHTPDFWFKYQLCHCRLYDFGKFFLEPSLRLSTYTHAHTHPDFWFKHQLCYCRLFDFGKFFLEPSLCLNFYKIGIVSTLKGCCRIRDNMYISWHVLGSVNHFSCSFYRKEALRKLYKEMISSHSLWFKSIFSFSFFFFNLFIFGCVGSLLPHVGFL